MKRLLRVVGRGLAAILLLAVGAAVVARFSDGPLAVFPGGPLERGELAEEPVGDWSFAASIPEVELALENPPRSRTVWVVVHEGKLYVPCGFIGLPLWKQWPHEALSDGRAVLRIQGRRHRLDAVRVADPALVDTLAELVVRKYGLRGVSDLEDYWMFRLDPRESS